MEADRRTFVFIGLLAISLILVNIFLPGVWNEYGSLLTILTFAGLCLDLYLNHFQDPSSDIRIELDEEKDPHISLKKEHNWEKKHPWKYQVNLRVVNSGEMKGKIESCSIKEVKTVPGQEEDITARTLQMDTHRIFKSNHPGGKYIPGLDHDEVDFYLNVDHVKQHGSVIDDLDKLIFVLELTTRDNKTEEDHEVEQEYDVSSLPEEPGNDG
jgi:hypothetical protein